MAKDKGPRKPRAETPKGFRDYFGADVTERKAMLDKIAGVYHRHGFDPLETSAVETVEALGKFLPDVDRPNEGVFAWAEDGDWLALRYDLTAPLARVAAHLVVGVDPKPGQLQVGVGDDGGHGVDPHGPGGPLQHADGHGDGPSPGGSSVEHVLLR